jgi:hypothetical protein
MPAHGSMRQYTGEKTADYVLDREMVLTRNEQNNISLK